jgi:hypothetical protein
MGIKVKNDKKKVRVNITVDKAALEKAKDKLEMFGGKLSTLFNAYLSEFVTSMDKKYNSNHESIGKKFSDFESRLDRLERK